MFPLTRLHRQALATLALVVLTVLPTGYVGLTAWRIGRPGHRHAVEAEIGRALGLRVTLDSVRYPRPGQVIYEGMVLRQEEPRHKGLVEVARARTVRIKRGDRELALETDGLELRGESPKLALAQVGTLLQRAGGIALERISLAAGACVLDLGQPGARYDLREVVGTLQADPSTPTVEVSYRIVGSGGSTRCELSLTRDRKAAPVRTALAFRTMEGAPLPAGVLNPFFDADDWLGPGASVDGALALRQSGAKEWEADFRGNLFDVDLAALVGKRFPSHRLTGKARVALDAARWADRPGQGPGWTEARGELTAGQGTIGLGLLRALAAEMNFRPSPELARVDASRGEVEYRALGLSFAMGADGQIVLAGGLGNEYAPGVVIAGPTTALAYAPRGTANVRGLIKTLFPVTAANANVLVPLTPQSRILLALPAPPDVPLKPHGAN